MNGEEAYAAADAVLLARPGRKMCDAQAKRLTQEDFAMNHPAGRIGKRLILRVRDVMLTGASLPLIGPDVYIMEVRLSHGVLL